MKNRDRYVCGEHDFWVHFCCVAVVGAIQGAIVGLSFFSRGWAILLTIILGASCIGFCCGCWGDAAWEWVLASFEWLLFL